MLPCARSCIGEKLKSLPVACASSPRTEPLLFLYPRWFQETARKSYNVEARSRQYSSRFKLRSHELYATGGSDRLQSSTEVKCPDVPPPVNLPCLQHRASNKEQTKLEPTHGSVRSSTSISRRPLGPRVNKYHKHNIDVFALVKELTHHPPPALSKSEAILLDSSFLNCLTGTSGENIWRHHDGSGCLVHVQEPSSSSDSKRKVLLTGTKRAIEIARQNLQDSEARHRSHKTSNAVDNIKKTKDLDSTVYLRVDQIPRPKVWSLRSFAEYITKVVTARKPRAVERKLYPGDQSYNLTAARVLAETFDDPHTYQFQSSFALRHALEFCSVRTEIADSATIIWSSARKAGIVPDTSCYNFEIERNLAVKNGAGVKRLLKEMKITQTSSDSSTWACLFKAIQTRAGQISFLQLPEVQTALSGHTFRDNVLQRLVETTFEPSDSDPCCVAIFQERMSKTFPGSWLTPRVIQCMIEKCTKDRAFQTVSSVLRLATGAHIKVDQQTSTALFKAVGYSRWFEDVLLLLRILSPSELDHLFNQDRMEIVFREAWRQQLANTCRVIWRYAASHGYIRYTMLAKVARELTQNVHPSKKPQVRLDARMAAVIVGVNQSFRSDTTTSSESKSDSARETILRLTEWTPMGERRHNQMQLAHSLLEQDLATWQRCVPMNYETLLTLLEEAFALDLKWLSGDVLSKSPVLELVERAIQVNFQAMKPYDIPSNIQSNLGEHDTNADITNESATSLYQHLDGLQPHSHRLSSNNDEMEHNEYSEDLKNSRSMSLQSYA